MKKTNGFPWNNAHTLVTPIVPTFSPKVLVPLPQPQIPAITVPKPSVPIPRFITCKLGGGPPVIGGKINVLKSISKRQHFVLSVQAYHTF